MDTHELIDALRVEGTRLAETAERCSLGAAIPTCPGWTVRDLLRHIGAIHRWAGTHVREARGDLVHVDELEDVVGGWPDDRNLVGWYQAEHALLVDSLASADPDLACFAFLPARSGTHFWARRQAHETAIHRVDVESAAGEVTPLGPALAVDGIDELLAGFVPRPRTSPRLPSPRTLRVAPDDDGARWLLRIGPDPTVTTRERGDTGESADCTVRGPASDLHLALWNRRGLDGLVVEGDAGVLDHFRANVTIRWT